MSKHVVAALSVASIVFISVTATIEPRTFAFLTAVPFGDKIGHFGLFGLLTMALIWANPGKRQLMYAAIVALLLVVLEESAQMFVTTRTFSLADLSASVLGVCSASGVYYVYRNRIAT